MSKTIGKPCLFLTTLENLVVLHQEYGSHIVQLFITFQLVDSCHKYKNKNKRAWNSL